MDKYYLVKLLANTSEQYVPSIDVYNTKDGALIAYHNILAAYHNAEDVLYAVVEILNGNGYVIQSEIVDHRPPEPEPEPESEE